MTVDAAELEQRRGGSCWTGAHGEDSHSAIRLPGCGGRLLPPPGQGAVGGNSASSVDQLRAFYLRERG